MGGGRLPKGIHRIEVDGRGRPKRRLTEEGRDFLLCEIMFSGGRE